MAMLVAVVFILFWLPSSSCHCSALFNKSVFLSPVTTKRQADKCVYELVAISSCVLDLNPMEVNVGDRLKCWVSDENDEYRVGCQCEEWQCESYEDEIKEHFEMFGRMWKRQVTSRPCIYKSSRTKPKKRGNLPSESVQQYVRENYSNIIIILVVFIIFLLGIILVGLGARCYRNKAKKRRSEKERQEAMETTSE